MTNILVRWFMYHRGRAWASMRNLLFCHGTQIMDNSRICHRLLFHEHGKQNFVQLFRLSRKLLRYTHAWTKLHNEVMSWISGVVSLSVIMHGPYLKRAQLLCVIWWYHLWVACPCLSMDNTVVLYYPWSIMVRRRAFIDVDLVHRTGICFSTCANLKPVCSIGIWSHADIHTYTSSNAVTQVWGLLRLAPISNLLQYFLQSFCQSLITTFRMPLGTSTVFWAT